MEVAPRVFRLVEVLRRRLSDPLGRFIELVHDFLHNKKLPLRNEGNDVAFTADTSCSAGAVDKDIGIVREFIDKDVGYIRKVKASCGDIGCNKVFYFALRNLLVMMERISWVSPA